MEQRRRWIASLALALSVLVVIGRPGPAMGKPRPGVSVKWVTPERWVPGEELALQVVVSVRYPVQRLSLEVRVPPGIVVLGPVPSYVGSPFPGDPLHFNLRVRVPVGMAPPLEARVSVRAGVAYQVAAALDLSTVSPEPSRAPPRRILTPSGESLEFGEVPETRGPTWKRGPSRAPEPGLGGRILYRDRSQGPEGFLHSQRERDPLRPVRYADVDLLKVTPGGDLLLARGRTDADGRFDFAADGGGYPLRARVYSSTSRWSVAGGAALFVKRSPARPTLYSASTEPVASDGLDVSFVIEAGAGGEVFNILDACVEGVQFLHDQEAAYPGKPLSAYWEDAQNVSRGCTSDGTYYEPETKTLHLLCDEGYDDGVILHEFGHYAADLYSRDDSPQGEHYVDDSDQDVRLAWSEGWASYVSCAVRARAGDPYPAWYVDTAGTKGRGQLLFSYECEGPGFSVRGTGSEVVVQALLWDITDGPDTPDDWPDGDDDPLRFPPSAIWAVVAGPLRQATTVSLEDFWDGWFSPPVANGHEAEMRITFGTLGVECYADAVEDAEAQGGASILGLDGLAVHRTFFPRGDVDEHEILLRAGEAVTVETLNLVGFGDTRLEIRDPEGEVLASNDNRCPGDLSSEVNIVARADGVHRVRVERAFSTEKSAAADYGSYDVRAVRGRVNRVPLADRAQAKGVVDRGYGVGVAFADFNADGRCDIYVVNNGAGGEAGAEDALYLNLGGRFTEALAGMGGARPEGGVGAAWGDYDGDGDPDLFVTDHGLYRNEGGTSFLDVTTASGVVDIGREYDASWVDADGDGLLDLFVVDREGPPALWRNRGDGTFADVAPRAGFLSPPAGNEAASCSWADFDGDFRPDLCVTYRQVPGLALYRNLGGNRFQDVTTAAGVSVFSPATGTVWGDLNGDGFLDLFVACTGANRLFVNRGDGTFGDEANRYGVTDLGTAQGAALADYDLDGDLDLFVSRLLSPSLLFENLGGVFVRVNQAGDPGAALGCAWGDIDDDGDPDLYVARGCAEGCENDLLYENQAERVGKSHWIRVRPIGEITHRDARGAVIRVHAGGRVQTRQVGTGTGWASKSLLPELFGLGAATVDSVEVLWPSGVPPTVVVRPESDRLLEMRESAVTPVRREDPRPSAIFRLSPPFPNPFRTATSLGFELDRASPVRVEVFDLAGRRVRVVLDRALPAGSNVAGWDGRDDTGREAPAGLYFYRLAAGERVRVARMVKTGG